MATYWTKLDNWQVTEQVELTSNLQITLEVRKIYASGDDIDFDFLLGMHHRWPLPIHILNTTIDKFTLQSSSNRKGYENHLIFERCKVNIIEILNLQIPSISLLNCTVTQLDILNETRLDKLSLQDGSKVLKFRIDNSCSVGTLEIKSNCEVGTTTIENSALDSLHISDSKIDSIVLRNNSNLNNLVLSTTIFNEFLVEELDISEEFSIKDCRKGNIRLNLCELKTIEFKLIESSIQVTLTKVRSYNKQIFRLTGSNESIIHFERCYFANEVLFQGSFYRRNTRNLIIKNTVFKDLVLFDDDHCKCLTVTECLFQKGILLPILDIKSPFEISSSAWCMLKNQALSRNENINAFEYRKSELTSYTEELKQRKVKTQERIVLFFNRISNNHGVDWFRGILFTTISWMFFYITFLLAQDGFYCLTHWNCKFVLFSNNFWVGAINYLWIPQGLEYLTTGISSLQSKSVLILLILSFLLGKIFIAYGIFQTISAFRRHGRA